MLTPLERWARKMKMNPNSPTTQRFYANRHLTVQEYMAKFRKGRINQVLPTEAKTMSVEEALQKRRVGRRNIRKLLGSGHSKFRKGKR